MFRGIPFSAKSKRFLRLLRQNWTLLVLLLPALVWVVRFCYQPMYGIVLAFKKYKPFLGISGSPWVELKNFEKFMGSYYFGEVLGNTLLLSLKTLVFAFPFPLLAALFLNQLQSRKYQKVIQTVTYAPHFISTVVLVGMLNIFLSPYSGIVARLIELFGRTTTNLSGSKATFRPIYILAEIWQNTGFNMIIYLATLSGVDPTLYEAAAIDGSNRLQRIWYIDLPALMPTVTICFILSLGGVMNVGFEKVFLMQNDMNLAVSEVISTYVYKRGLVEGDMGLSTAFGLFNNIINIILLIGANYLSRLVNETSLW